MSKDWIKLPVMFLLLASCTDNNRPADGFSVESQILSNHNLSKDYSDTAVFLNLVKDINCADSTVLGKRLVLANHYHSWDTTEILLIPYIPNGQMFKSSAYSDIDNRFVLINPTYIHEFAIKNTLNDTTAYIPLLELMVLHEIGHFILKRPGAFDKLESMSVETLGQQEHNDTQPEYITTAKKLELSADSLAIDLVRRKLKSTDYGCLNIAFDVERVLPGMQFQLSGTRIITDFGRQTPVFLHDPSNDHPNMELRVTFMNYFLFPNESLRQMIEEYIYNRTVAPVHRQEFDPRIYQGKEKKADSN